MVTASNSSAIANSHSLQFTTARTKCSQSTLSTSCWLVAASNGGRSPYSGFPNCPRPQLPASNSNSSHWLYSSSLTNSPTSSSLPCTAPSNSSGYISARTAQKTQFLCWSIHCCVRSHGNGPRRKHHFPASPLARVKNLLPSNGRCSQSHHLATGLHTILSHTIKQRYTNSYRSQWEPVTVYRD
jgi:hypothetical protein